jgi:hypothetical protein
MPNQAKTVSRKESVFWQDLDQPRQVVLDVANKAGLAVANPEAIPHDLWASAILPQATLSESLSLILIQFDLTFAWNADGSEIRLVPVPDVVVVEKPHTPAGGPSGRAPRAARQRFLQAAATAWEQNDPGLSVSIDLDNNRLLVKGTVEQHEALEGGNPLTAIAKPAAANSPPLEKQSFTLRIERVRVIDLMKRLEESDVEFVYDKDQLKTKNIDLEATINMDVNKASADEFFRAMFDPLGLKFSYKNHTVSLVPK